MNHLVNVLPCYHAPPSHRGVLVTDYATWSPFTTFPASHRIISVEKNTKFVKDEHKEKKERELSENLGAGPPIIQSFDYQYTMVPSRRGRAEAALPTADTCSPAPVPVASDTTNRSSPGITTHLRKHAITRGLSLDRWRNGTRWPRRWPLSPGERDFRKRVQETTRAQKVLVTKTTKSHRRPAAILFINTDATIEGVDKIPVNRVLRKNHNLVSTMWGNPNDENVSGRRLVKSIYGASFKIVHLFQTAAQHFLKLHDNTIAATQIQFVAAILATKSLLNPDNVLGDLTMTLWLEHYRVIGQSQAMASPH
ncbi:hypothetical protein J6590_040748 [Homalodisca vitripennis]|nr:hypothetical protein J6590_040748 [Homalodisca vitripennis]